MRSFFFTAALLTLQSNNVSAECDQCTFTDGDADDCKVYGQLGDRALIAWSKASQACLDEFQIKDEAVDPAVLDSAFPNSDGSGGNVNAFVNYLKFNSDTVANGIKLSFSDFFDENEATSGVVFKDSITVDGTSYDCAASESDCYNALKTYFGSEPGASEMQDIGADLHNRVAFSLEKEQGLVRIRLCADGSTSGDCEPLATQVADVKGDNPDKACSAYALGPAGIAIPGCNGATGGTGSNTDPTSVAYNRGSSLIVAVGVMASAFYGFLL